MPKQVQLYDLLISCPGDITAEIDLIKSAVEKFNSQFSDTLGISIRIKHWSKDSYPQSGGKPQELLNRQFVKECDAAVALFWTRFGTPTDQYGSGTEEEIEIMLEAGKQVFMYFSDKPIPPSAINQNEYERVLAFRKKYQSRGLYSCYATEDAFSSQFFAHLTKHFLSVQAVKEVTIARTSNIVLKGIDQNERLIDCFPICGFRLNSSCSSASILEEIQQLYSEISELNVGKRITIANANSGTIGAFFADMYSSLNTPVEIDEHTQALISSFAEKLQIPIGADFFSVGNLTKAPLSVSAFGTNIKGTEQEEEKYWKICDLEKNIRRFSYWHVIEQAYAGIKCLKFAVENNGTAIDEDIEIELRFAKEDLLRPRDFPTINCSEALKYLMDKHDLFDLFSISPTFQYKSFEDSQKGPLVPPVSLPSDASELLYGRDYQKEYRNQLRAAYYNDVYLDNEQYVIKVKVDYLKHHSIVAFPTPILLCGTPNIVEYRITSKNAADILAGKIDIVST